MSAQETSAVRPEDAQHDHAPQESPPSLRRLIDEIRGAVAAGGDAAETSRRVTRTLERHLVVPDLLPAQARVADPERYRQNIVHVEPDGSFSIVALVWLPGQQTPVHDHISWCVVGVYEGEEAEIRYRVEDTVGGEVHLADGQVPDPEGGLRLVRTAEVTNPNGSADGFAPPGDLHRVWNAGEGTAISIHVYGADIRELGSSIRRTYDLPER
ncbi:cysteine dioxygenase family protein [Brachybacterium subflavum]|uniref:cysteine dioxygenase family protein n=1 Tax=Brachybacterium subflavum TaxID=2585206 RepID=UPI0012661CF5|nr:cysteine dioxygenase family protein [Brachybacterium subflavum]